MKPEEWEEGVGRLRWQHRLNEAGMIRERRRFVALLWERAVQVRSSAIEDLRQAHLERAREQEERMEAIAGGYNVAEIDGELQVVPDRFGPYTMKGALRRVRKAIRKEQNDEVPRTD